MQLTDKEFVRLRDYMYQNFGINLAQKRTLIEGRLNIVVQKKGFKSFDEYIDNLLKDETGEEVSILVSRLTTNFTYFMREEEHFHFLRNVILPEIVPKIRDKNLCIWSAGCSSGEEPYTIAMNLDDYFKFDKRGLDTRVLATDISMNVLRKAVEGVYSYDRISRLPAGWAERYFKKIGSDQYHITPELRKEVIFREFNLMTPVFKFRHQFHVIFCRNVMIYFDRETRERLARKFYDALVPGGYLMIGMSETLANSNTGFQYVKPSIYQKR